MNTVGNTALMASKRIIKPKDQGDIKLMFTKPVAKKATPIVAPVAILTTTNPEVEEFYKSLTAPERIAHEIAVEKLGTSYDVTRTHGFLRFAKK
jgi:hypothetical protein